MPDSSMKKLGIHFADRDFVGDVRNFMGVFEYCWRGCCFNKSQIVQLFNQAIGPLYWVRKGNVELGGYGSHDFPNLSFLKISERNVYIDDEVDALIAEHEGNINGEFVYIDFHLVDGPLMYEV